MTQMHIYVTVESQGSRQPAVEVHNASDSNNYAVESWAVITAKQKLQKFDQSNINTVHQLSLLAKQSKFRPNVGL